jgi:hypothetical protein
MVRFHAHQFVRLVKILDRIAILTVPSDKSNVKMTVDAREAWSRDLAAWANDFAEVNLRLSAKTVQRASHELREKDITFDRLGFLVRDLHQRIEDELEDQLIYSLEPSKLFFLGTDLFDLEQTKKFSTAWADIEEAGKCLAFNRASAGVFHLMRVMEVGLRALGSSLNDPNLDPKRNPSWESILRKCDNELKEPLAKRSSEWQ